MDVSAFIEKWSGSAGAERANFQPFVYDLCDVLGVDRPEPTKSDDACNVYVFERDVLEQQEDGTLARKRIDLYRAGCFVMEAKQGADPNVGQIVGAKKIGIGKRDGWAWPGAMMKAKGQAIGYARMLEKPPPFVVVCDVGYCFELYASFSGQGIYRDFPNAQSKRIYLKDLGDEKKREVLRRIFVDPHSLDPRKQQVAVTKDVAAKLARLAESLEHQKKHAPESVAKFIMRCLFTMFAEDVELIPKDTFTNFIRDYWIPNPKGFPGGVEQFWRTMDKGGSLVSGEIIRRFNGGLLENPTALPLNKDQLEILYEAARCDWSNVEPAIFGTLLERALSKEERHKLGAHFTPRAYVERLVRPTVEEPLREEWETVQAEVLALQKKAREIQGVVIDMTEYASLTAAERKKLDAKTRSADKERDKLEEEARQKVRAFHHRLTETRVLDPACGSGNFLYVTLDVFMRLESEVIELLKNLGEPQEKLEIDRVTPKQFLGIEKKRWAKEIAELVLWIGYLQWHYRIHGKSKPPPEPVMQDYKNIECRDAVLDWDAIEIERDPKTGKPKTRWDGESMKRSPVTGELVPDEDARVEIERYVNPRKAEWPEAEFVVGNPPFIGNKRMRAVLGDGYAEALRAAYLELPESVDFVMFWWRKAQALVNAGGVARFGFITTNSITQGFNRRIVEEALRNNALSLVFALPDHPWVDSESGADVRIAMSACAKGDLLGTLLKVRKEGATGSDGSVATQLEFAVGKIHADFRVGADVSRASPLQSNAALSYQGVVLVGDGFRMSEQEVEGTGIDPNNPPGVLRRYFIGRDVMRTPEKRWVIDFFGLTAEDAREQYPTLYQRVHDLVKPARDLNRRDSIRDLWWRFAWDRPLMRGALHGLSQYIVTCRTAKHRVFVFFDGTYLADAKLVVIALDDGFSLGVLSSSIHTTWSFNTGGFLGVGNDSDYIQQICFGRFPFPSPSDPLRDRIRSLAESLDAHRKRQQAAHPDLTLTGMYNVLEKLRSGEELTAKERVIHEHGLVSVLKQIHDDLDAAVFDAYGWPHDLGDEQILERLVALNAERADEERRGVVRWLRPEFQNPQGKTTATQVAMANVEAENENDEVQTPAAAPTIATWPKKLAEQITAVRDRVVGSGASWSTEQIGAQFQKAREPEVESILESLAMLGIVVALQTDSGRRWKAAARAASS